MAIVMDVGGETQYTVRQDKRTIGFIILMSVPGRRGWYFIANRKDISARVPKGVCHGQPADALEFARKVLS